MAEMLSNISFIMPGRHVKKKDTNSETNSGDFTG